MRRKGFGFRRGIGRDYEKKVAEYNAGKKLVLGHEDIGFPKISEAALEEAREELRSILKSKLSEKSEEVEELLPHLVNFYAEYKHLKGQKVMVLFSGGLDTSCLTHILTHIIGAEVHTFSANVGSVTAPNTNMEEITHRSKEVGAVAHHVIDCRDKLAQIAFGALKAEAQMGRGALGHHPASSLSRVAICDAAVQCAKENQITAIMHGSNGSQNNPFRFSSALRFFSDRYSHSISEYTPNMGDTTLPREVEAKYLQAFGISQKSTVFEKDVSHDRNLVGDEWEEASIANPNNRLDIRETIFKDIVPPTSPINIGIRFKDGLPVAVRYGDQGFIEKSPLEIMESLNVIGMQYQLGIYDYPEGRPSGIRAREIHIAPAMQILTQSHNWLRAYQLSTEENQLYNKASIEWSHLVLEKAQYTSSARHRLDGLFNQLNQGLDGEVSMDLEIGKISNITSPHAEKYMETKVPPATRDFVSKYYQQGIGSDIRSTIESFEQQLKEIQTPSALPSPKSTSSLASQDHEKKSSDEEFFL